MTEQFKVQHQPGQYFPWVKCVFHQLSIRQKIVCGYAVTLGIAVLGTATGLIIGSCYFQQARQLMIVADDEGSLLSNLQGVLLGIQSHQQEIVFSVNQPQHLERHSSEVIAHLAETETLLHKLHLFSQTKSQTDLQALLKEYDSAVMGYIRETKTLTQQLLTLGSQPQRVENTQKLIWQFDQSLTKQKFLEFSHKLADFAETVRDRQTQADAAINQAKLLEIQIIASSIIISLGISIIIAAYTSNIILSPLLAVISVANQVTQEANFDLQVPLTTNDEVGKLANTLNLLIQQVKQLLEAQQAETQTRLIQSEKMSSLGQMIAGVAHEINNPVNYISGNLNHAKTYTDDIFRLLKAYKQEFPDPVASVDAIAQEIDIEFIKEDLPKLLTSMEFGANRAREIAQNLKDFSRIDDGEVESVDLHTCIDSTLLILQNRLKSGIDVIRNYGDIPTIKGYTGLLYQVFMNLLSNSIDALEEKQATNTEFKPVITITTTYINDSITVKITDNGLGISSENKSKIFDDFFTTKPRGVGTGLGLAITYEIVTQKHHGEIIFQSELEQGTQFEITLPVRE
jgi:two-component system, NtrC family, sensor kinase